MEYIHLIKLTTMLKLKKGQSPFLTVKPIV
jgi:hypothetical protein